MANYLNLSEEQKEQMKMIHEYFRQERDILFTDESLSKENRREKVQQMHETLRSEIENILTDEQIAKMEEHRSERYKRRGNRQNKHHYGEFMNEDIHALILDKRSEFDSKLTSEEKEIIDEIRAQIPEGLNMPIHGKYRDKSDKMKENRECIKENFEPLVEIAKNHNDELETIAKEIKQEIRENIREDTKEYNHKRESRKRPEKRNRMMMHFLLLDPNDDQANIRNVEESDQVKLYPNPVNSMLNIEFETDERENVSVELVNKYGYVLEVIDVSNRDAGQHTCLYNAGMLPGGEVYYIRVSKNDLVQVEKFIKL